MDSKLISDCYIDWDSIIIRQNLPSHFRYRKLTMNEIDIILHFKKEVKNNHRQLKIINLSNILMILSVVSSFIE